MIITKLIMQGFKNHKERVEFDMGLYTLIQGDNYQGKTTLGEAITWCLTGTDLNGNEKATNRLLNNESKDMQVEITFTFNDTQHNLIRNRKGSKTDIYLDGSLVKATDLSVFYKDKDTFLTIFNPSYFASLSPKAAKELLDSNLRKVTNEEVFEELTKIEVDLLIKNGFKNSNLFLDTKRSELKEIEKDILFSQGFIAAKEEKIEIPKELFFNNAELERLENKRSDITSNISTLNDLEQPILLSISELEFEQTSMRAEYRRIKSEISNLKESIECPNCKETIELDVERRNSLVSALNDIEIKGQGVSENIEKNKKANDKTLEVYNRKLKENQTEISKLEEELSKIHQLREIQLDIKQKVDSNNATRISLLQMQKENDEKAKKAIAEIESQINKKTDISLQIDAAKTFNSVKLKMQSSNMKDHLKHVDIQLEKITKEGELKDDFKILYKGREFVLISVSERINAGLEIANLIMAETQISLPIFIDNAESITSFEPPNGQVIVSRVVEGQALNVVSGGLNHE